MGNADLIPMQHLNPEIPYNISDAILKALALKPQMRFENVAAFQQALEDPSFQLNAAGRQGSTAADTVQGAAKVSEKAAEEGGKRKKPSLWLVLGIGGGVLALAALCLVLLLALMRGNILDLIAHTAPTATFTATATVAVAPTETQAVVNLPPTDMPTDIPPTATMQPTITNTLEPSPTAELEGVGGSGLLAFASDRGEDGFVQIWTMRVSRDIDGEIRSDSFTQLTFDPGDKDQPVWSPDGSRIAFVALGEERTGKDIWVMNADGSEPVNISWGIGDEFDPAWTPDGERVIFTNHYRDSGGRPIYALDWVKPDGTDRARLSGDFVESDPTFSPDGSWLLYVISAQSHHYFHFRGDYDDYQSPRGFDLREIFGEFGEVSDPAWAPAGDQFAYTRHDGTRQNVVLVTYESIQRNGVHFPTEYPLTDTDADTDAAWSPDARWLAFTSMRDGGDSEIYLMTTTGRPQINLTQREGIDREPSWAPVLTE